MSSSSTLSAGYCDTTSYLTNSLPQAGESSAAANRLSEVGLRPSSRVGFEDIQASSQRPGRGTVDVQGAKNSEATYTIPSSSRPLVEKDHEKAETNNYKVPESLSWPTFTLADTRRLDDLDLINYERPGWGTAGKVNWGQPKFDLIERQRRTKFWNANTGTEAKESVQIGRKSPFRGYRTSHGRLNRAGETARALTTGFPNLQSQNLQPPIRRGTLFTREQRSDTGEVPQMICDVIRTAPSPKEHFSQILEPESPMLIEQQWPRPTRRVLQKEGVRPSATMTTSECEARDPLWKGDPPVLEDLKLAALGIAPGSENDSTGMPRRYRVKEIWRRAEQDLMDEKSATLIHVEPLHPTRMDDSPSSEKQPRMEASDMQQEFTTPSQARVDPADRGIGRERQGNLMDIEFMEDEVPYESLRPIQSGLIML